MANTVFVSGSNRGIGKEIIKLFAEQGWNVIAHARAETNEFKELISDLGSKNGVSIIPVFFDMRDDSEMKEQIQNVVSKPKIEINALINNAGVMDVKLFMMASMASIREVYDINLFSHMRITQLLLKRMPAGSSIVNVASMDAYNPQRGESAYASSKAALCTWTEVLGKELAGRIRVNAVAPNAVDTEMAKAIADKANWKPDDLIDAKSVAKTIYFLASDGSEAVTGEIIKIKGKQI